MMMASKQYLVVDARFKSCPGPLISLIEAVKKAKPGQVIKLLTTDPTSPRDVKEWAKSTTHKLLEIKEKENVYEIYVEVADDGLG
ncbi:MAG: sulfurtransferase TusA family protein [Nitrososphaerota archaeon]|nr:sulfurtransferase TusA family protein [Aigarchaeota archaeon]MDW8076538.1 sulfurtransferase TusA family protein [Nitrososphaerota archaeon]